MIGHTETPACHHPKRRATARRRAPRRGRLFEARPRRPTPACVVRPSGVPESRGGARGWLGRARPLTISGSLKDPQGSFRGIDLLQGAPQLGRDHLGVRTVGRPQLLERGRQLNLGALEPRGRGLECNRRCGGNEGRGGHGHERRGVFVAQGPDSWAERGPVRGGWQAVPTARWT